MMIYWNCIYCTFGMCREKVVVVFFSGQHHHTSTLQSLNSGHCTGLMDRGKLDVVIAVTKPQQQLVHIQDTRYRIPESRVHGCWTKSHCGDLMDHGDSECCDQDVTLSIVQVSRQMEVIKDTCSSRSEVVWSSNNVWQVAGLAVWIMNGNISPGSSLHPLP